MTVISMTTDFGAGDHEVGVMRGVIYRIAPQAKLADLSHDIPPQDILEGALILSQAASYFPPGTVHLAVIDPGVGTARRPIAGRVGDSFFVGPDNGLFSLLWELAEEQRKPVEVFHLDNPDYWLPVVSRVFHGRDIFAPVAAHLANGVALEAIGKAITDPVRIVVPKPTKTDHGWQAEVISVDAFGTLNLNLRADQLTGNRVTALINGKKITDFVKTFGERPAGTAVLMIDSSGWLSIAIVNGSAAARLGAKNRTPVEIVCE